MPHHVRPTIDRFGIRLEFTCTEPETATCHTFCDGMCEYWNTDDGVTCKYCGTLLLHSSECTMLQFLDDDPIECFAGEQTTLKAGQVDIRFVHEEIEWSYTKPKNYQQLTDEDYRRVAETYRYAMANGLPIHMTVAANRGVSKSYAASLIHQARVRGFLPPTSKGRRQS